MRMLAVAVVVSTIIVAFAFRYAPVLDPVEAGPRPWAFDHLTREFHPQKGTRFRLIEEVRNKHPRNPLIVCSTSLKITSISDPQTEMRNLKLCPDLYRWRERNASITMGSCTFANRPGGGSDWSDQSAAESFLNF